MSGNKDFGADLVNLLSLCIYSSHTDLVTSIAVEFYLCEEPVT